MSENIEANFSTLILSIASSAAMNMGMAPNPTNGKTEKNKEIAKFNIDLLLTLQDKTKNNLNPEETKFLTQLIYDLQLQFVNVFNK